MNGEVFKGLKKLNQTFLSSNVCIKDDFIGQFAIALMPKFIEKKCSFDEPNLLPKKEVSCDYVRFEYETGLTCSMSRIAFINTTGVTISASRNESIMALTLILNNKIKYLPENIVEKFPNLDIYFAKFCSLTSISKRNFNGLSVLTKISLKDNKIEKIPSDTFEDLKNLKSLDLGK